MAQLNYTTRSNIYSGGPEVGNDIGTALDEIRTAVNSVDATQLATDAVTTAKIQDGAVTSAKIADATIATTDLSTALSQRAGVSNGANIADGRTVIAGAEARTSTSFGTLTTPDQVSNVVLPTDGLIFVVYSALWKESVADTARAAIFIGGTQLFVPVASGSAQLEAARTGAGAAGAYAPLVSFPGGLLSSTPVDGVTDSTFVTSGQAVAVGSSATRYEAGVSLAGPSGGGGICVVEAAAGTYNVSVQFRATGGATVTVKNRALRVWTKSFS